MKVAILLLSLLFTTFVSITPAKAEEDEQFELDTMNIEGDYEAPTSNNHSSEAQSERLKKMRVALEKRNEVMIRRKIEQLRVKQEVQIMRQIQRAMNQTMKDLDKI